MRVPLGLIALGLCLSQCISDVPKYKWFPAVTAPVQYPVRVIAGSLGLAGGDSIGVPDSREAYSGWGLVGPIEIIGQQSKDLPSSGALFWFSYVENRFYRGTFELNTDSIATLFAQGSTRRNGTITPYNRILLGMAPLGVVVVWIASANRTVEVGKFQLPQVESDVFDKYTVPREEVVRERLDGFRSRQSPLAILSHRDPGGFASKYRTRYAWTPIVVGTTQALEMDVRTFDGEREVFSMDREVLRTDPHALPMRVRLWWKHSDGQSLVDNVILDENAVFDAFAKLSPLKDAGPLRLQVDVDQISGHIAISLRNDKFILKIPSTSDL